MAESNLRDKITIGRQDLENLRDRVLREYGGDLEDVKQREGSGAEISIPSKNEIIHLMRKRPLGERFLEIEEIELDHTVKSEVVEIYATVLH
jgi:hypothetical protein